MPWTWTDPIDNTTQLDAAFVNVFIGKRNDLVDALIAYYAPATRSEFFHFPLVAPIAGVAQNIQSNLDLSTWSASLPAGYTNLSPVWAMWFSLYNLALLQYVYFGGSPFTTIPASAPGGWPTHTDPISPYYPNPYTFGLGFHPYGLFATRKEYRTIQNYGSAPSGTAGPLSPSQSPLGWVQIQQGRYCFNASVTGQRAISRAIFGYGVTPTPNSDVGLVYKFDGTEWLIDEGSADIVSSINAPETNACLQFYLTPAWDAVDPNEKYSSYSHTQQTMNEFMLNDASTWRDFRDLINLGYIDETRRGISQQLGINGC